MFIGDQQRRARDGTSDNRSELNSQLELKLRMSDEGLPVIDRGIGLYSDEGPTEICIVSERWR